MRVPPDQSGTAFATSRDGAVDVALAQVLRDARQPRGEQERLDAVVPSCVEAVDEVQQHPRVAFHGAADVADHHQPARLLLAAARLQPHELAAVARVVAQRPAHVQPRPSPRFLAPRSPEAGVPSERGHQLARLQHLLRRELREVPRSQYLPCAERSREVYSVETLVRVGGLGGVVRLAARRGRPGGRPAIAALLAHRAQVHRRGAVLALPPEDVERLVEQGEVVLVVHEQRAQRGAHVAPAFEADVLEHADGVQHPSDVHVQAEPPEQPSE